MTNPTTNAANTRKEKIEKAIENASDGESAYFISLYKNQQNVLIYNASELARYNKRFFTLTEYPDHGTAQTPPEINGPEVWQQIAASAGQNIEEGGPQNDHIPGTEEPWISGYSMLSPIISRGMSTDETVNRLIGHAGSTLNYYNFVMTAAQQAALVPKIRLFKVEYATETGPEGFESIKEPLEAEAFREIEFGAFTNTEDVEAMALHSSPRLRGAGIKSFEWDLKGVNPAEVDANIEASLNIYFNAVDDVFLNNINMKSLSTTKGLASFMDLVVFAPPKARGPEPCAKDYSNPAYFEIAVEVGWQLPSRDVATMVGDTGASYIEDYDSAAAIAYRSQQDFLFTEEQYDIIKHSSTAIYYLQLTDHEFEFSDDGSATLVANYRARNRINDERVDLLRGVSAAVDTERAQLDIAKEALEALDSKLQHDSAEAKEQQRAEGALKKAVKKQYKSLIYELVGKHVYRTSWPTGAFLNFRQSSGIDLAQGGGADPIEGKIISYSALMSALGTSGTGAGGTVGDTDVYSDVVKVIQRDLGAFTTSSNRRNGTSITGPGPLGPRARAAIAHRSGQDSMRGAKDIVDEIVEDDGGDIIQLESGHDMFPTGAGYASRNLQDLDADGNHDHIEVQFFYLGDLLEVFMSYWALANEVTKDRMAFVTLDMQYLNDKKLLETIASPGSPGDALQYDGADLESLRCIFRNAPPGFRDPYISRVNIANIPIQAQLFLDFIKHKIVAELRTSYLLDDFINDIFNEFIKPIVMTSPMLGAPMNAPSTLILGSIVDKKTCPLTQDHEVAGYASGYDLAQGNPLMGPSRILGDRGRPYDIWDILAPDSQASGDATFTGRPNYGHGFGGGPPRSHSHIGTAQGYLERAADLSGLQGPNGIPLQEYPPFLQTMQEPSWPSNLSAVDPLRSTPKVAPPVCDVRIIALITEFTRYNGDYQDNVTRGIPNLVMGLDRGIVKSMNFLRVDQPYLRESRVSKSRSASAMQLRELYNVSIELYGNLLLKPGMIIYVEANPTIFGKPTTVNSPARLLGMGGYHLVTSVSNKISLDGWDTTVNALHVATPPPNSVASTGFLGPMSAHQAHRGGTTT
jgi:hypothetical protein